MLYAAVRSECLNVGDVLLRQPEQRVQRTHAYLACKNKVRPATRHASMVVRIAPVGGGCRAPADTERNQLSQGTIPGK